MPARQCPKLGDDAPRVLVYTDGGCSPNPGAGGWAAILLRSDEEIEIAGADPESTNNRMEITAALEALLCLEAPSRVTIVTDSEYVFKGMTEWIGGWSRKAFCKKGKPMLNDGLWRALAQAALEHDTSWAWTRGHAGDPLNERCDGLVGEMIGRRPPPGETVLHRSTRPLPGALRSVAARPTMAIVLDD